MDNRTKDFIEKFIDAQRYLGGNSVQSVVSLKYREVGGNPDYYGFIEEYLRINLNLRPEQVKGNFQGQAWHIKDSNDNDVILVEHETGLEILYIAGSIASLLSLIPMINSGWRYWQSRRAESRYFQESRIGVEIRKVNSKNQLVEHHLMSIEDYILTESLIEIVNLRERVNRLEQEMAEINKGNKESVKKSTKHMKT